MRKIFAAHDNCLVAYHEHEAVPVEFISTSLGRVYRCSRRVILKGRGAYSSVALDRIRDKLRWAES